MKPIFELELLPEAAEFLEQLDPKAREKVYYNIKKSQYTLDQNLLKKLNILIWEFRTLYNGRSYRLFSFWDNTDGKTTRSSLPMES